MKARVQELLQIGDRLYSKRFPLLTLWQSFAENFYPIRADMTRSRYISEEFASYLQLSAAVHLRPLRSEKSRRFYANLPSIVLTRPCSSVYMWIAIVDL